MSEPDQPTLGLGLFPDQIISEILTRLPVKSICRFKCVSKLWLSLITTPHFLTSYISLSSPSWAILDRIIRVDPLSPNKPIFNLSPLMEPPNINPFSITTHFADPCEPARKNFPAIISTSNGLLLFAAVKGKRDPYEEHKKNPDFFSHETTEDRLFVCNPITRQWAHIPKTREPLGQRGAVGFVTRVKSQSGLGLGCSFVVVEYQPIIGSQFASLVTYDSQTGVWVKKCGSYMLGMHFWRADGVFELNGFLFWFDLSCGLITTNDDPFKFSSKENEICCKFISLPEGCARPYYTKGLDKVRSINVGGGKFIQFLDISNVELRLWRLKDYKGGKWGLVYKVSFNDIWCDVSFLGCGVPKVMPYPVLFHPFEEDIVFFAVKDWIFSVNVKTKKVLSCGVYSSLIGKMFVAPYVVPGWPTSLPPLLTSISEKDLGNEYFKEKKFDEAINCYSKSITRSPTAMAYANRAAAFLQKSRYLQAESDCTEALMLEEKYMKAYARRAIARKEMGQLRAAKKDAELALKLNPQQDDILKLYAEIKSLLEKASIKGDGDDGVAPHP